uniref:Uncharacterized protein n=1 Tax=Daucus carota subsp. sativus TaxID=79200 RepID=A0A166IFN6_DAUCS
MNFKGRSAGRRSLRVPPTFFLCFFFFICGLFASKLLSRQVLSWKPRALYFPGFATPEQCESIIKIAKASLEPSTLALRKGEKAENLKGIRTSSGTFIKASEDKSGTLDIIEDKISSATMIPRTHGEKPGSLLHHVNQWYLIKLELPAAVLNVAKYLLLLVYPDSSVVQFIMLVTFQAFNILRYEIGQKYRPHYDAFNPNIYGQVKSQRVASFLLYLSDVEEGGETMFPYENGLNYDNYDPDACAGLKVKPRKGDGLLFYSLYPNGTIDKASLHGSCPVIRGQKWVATKWLRNQLWVPKGG